MSNQSTQYSFVSRKEDVDYDRVLRESPRGTQFILVEERTRKNQAISWTLLVHSSVLNDERIQGVQLGHDLTMSSVKTIGPKWGYDEVESTKLYSYRAISGDGSVPGYVKKGIDNIKRALNEKNTKTVVTLF